MKIARFGLSIVMALGLVLGCVITVSAQEAPTSSSNFQISEPQFGVNTESETCSGAYCASATIGSLDAGADEPPRSTEFGTIPQDSEPLLEVIVDPGESHLGVLSTSKSSSKTMIVRVRTYMSDGYTLHIYGDTPKYGDHSLSSLSTPSGSIPGVEQFGINVVRNAALGLGADPVQVPSDLMSFGEVSPDYGAADMFKYANGDAVARSTVETGRTDYTISMVINVSSATPAGHYSADYSAIVVPRF